jgi:hypothetical protein
MVQLVILSLVSAIKVIAMFNLEFRCPIAAITIKNKNARQSACDDSDGDLVASSDERGECENFPCATLLC